MKIIVYNFFLIPILCFLAPFIFTKRKFEKINKRYKIWVHCASLGEVKIALRVIKKIKESYDIPQSEILLTTTTLTAKSFAKKHHQDTFLFPIDFYFFTHSFVKKVLPKVLIIIETELWPNYIYFVKKFGGKIFLLNGRLSQKSFVFLKTFKWLLFDFVNSIDLFLVRETIDFLRFKKLGIPKEKIKITGNMKFDEIEEKIDYKTSKQTFGLKENDFVITFGSVREKEEKEIIKVIKAFQNNEKVKFVLAPRHIEYIPKIVSLLNKNQIKYNFVSSNLKDPDAKCLILDVYGKLKLIYNFSDIVFVCGTILPYGGQNMIEPASLGKFVVFGQYISNFLEPAKLLLSNNAAVQVKNMEEFIEVINKCLENPQIIKVYGEKAKIVVSQLKGVTGKNIEILKNVLTKL
jgi:3-deoxy-D-manno-octulosonic-acid transferase